VLTPRREPRGLATPTRLGSYTDRDRWSDARDRDDDLLRPLDGPPEFRIEVATYANIRTRYRMPTYL
jgi:hypothetical protein